MHALLIAWILSSPVQSSRNIYVPEIAPKQAVCGQVICPVDEDTCRCVGRNHLLGYSDQPDFVWDGLDHTGSNPSAWGEYRLEHVQQPYAPYSEN